MNKIALFLCMAFFIFPMGCANNKVISTSDPSTKYTTAREQAYLSCLEIAKKETDDPFKIVDSIRRCMRQREYTLEGLILSSEYTDSDGCPLDTDGDGVPDSIDKCPGTPKGVRVDSKGCPLDTDKDGVPDYIDECPGTPLGVKVDSRGCPLDTDGDGVPDYKDECPGTPLGVKVDSRGCPLDTDGDGVPDTKDKCPGTPLGVKVDSRGCPLDTDRDGVPDYKDECPGTPKGVKVDSRGCPLDTDGDGVSDYKDECPGTPKGAKVDERGCWVIMDTLFDYDKDEITPKHYYILNNVVSVLKRNPYMKIEIQGHTCNMGTAAYNQKLSDNRANSIMNYLIKKGIEGRRLSIAGYGFTRPKTTNETEEGRALNRRVELVPVH
jgi:hypothetical protein